MVKLNIRETNLAKSAVDWPTLPLDECLKIETGSRNTEDKNDTGKYPFFVRSQVVERINSFSFDCEAVLTAGDGVGTGKIFHYINGKFDAHQRVYVLSQFSNITAKYFYYFFKENFLKEVLKYTAKSSVDSVRRDMIAKMQIPVPAPAEQAAIAEAFSDADRLIASLQKLIAKKKAIKQGAMQELLTGKRRLPGFSGKWVEINLAKESKLKARIGWQGLTTAEYLSHGFAYLITGTDFKNGKIDWDNCCFVDKKRYDQDYNIQIANGDLLITKDGTIGKIAYVVNLTSPATLNSGVFVIRPISSDAYVTEFVYHIMNSFIFDEFLSKLSAGSTINHLYQKDFVNFYFYAPKNIDEQSAIAQVLSDMDTEIDKLENKLSKYQQIKQGMMQELLTGRIRLLKTEPAQKQPAPAKKHNQQFDDAVMIAGIVDAFYSETYPLGRKKIQKLLYLVRRKEEADVCAFQKKAAGPYADAIRYKGGEPIAKKSNYVAVQTSGKGTMFSRGAKIEQALGYIESWGKQASIDWLVSNFQRTRVDDLELFATVDMAICDLREMNKPVSVQSIKELIHSIEEWREKLEKSYFSDQDIQRAISKCREFFGEQ